MASLVISERRFNAMAAHLALLGLTGMLFFVAEAATRGRLPGLMTAVGAVWTMACSGCLRKYDRERGLWMLYLLFAVCSALLTSFFVIGLGDDVLSKRASGADIDGVCCTGLFAFSAWLLVSGAVWNWRRFKRGDDESPPGPPRPPEPTPVPAPVCPAPPALSARARIPVAHEPVGGYSWLSLFSALTLLSQPSRVARG